MCLAPAAVHQGAETRKNIIGGRKAGKLDNCLEKESYKLVNNIYSVLPPSTSLSRNSAISDTCE